MIIAVCLIIAAGLAVATWSVLKTKNGLTTTSDEQTPTELRTETDAAPKLIIGDDSAPITIIEYGDFQCPICKRFFDQTEPALISEYIDTKKAKIEFRVETHIGEKSALAGEAAYCAAEQDSFRTMHDKLYSEQGKTDFTATNLKGFAADLGLDTSAFEPCLDSHKYKATVAASHAESRSKISGTPTFFIGEQRINGAQPIAVFRAILDSQ